MLSAVDAKISGMISLVEGTLNDQDFGECHANRIVTCSNLYIFLDTIANLKINLMCF